MPTYRYLCKACEAVHEEFQSMSADPLRKCPACGKLKLERQIGPGAGFLFKGDGFYITDYRSDGYKKAASSDNGGAKTSGDGGSSDAKAPASSDSPTPASKPEKPSKSKKKD